MAKIDNNPKEPDPFDKADSPAAIMAYVFSKAGEDGLRALLDQIETDKESLERDATELDAIGLLDVAAIVKEAAKVAAIPTNPHPEGSANGRNWDRRHRGIFRGYQITEETAQ